MHLWCSHISCNLKIKKEVGAMQTAPEQRVPAVDSDTSPTATATRFPTTSSYSRSVRRPSSRARRAFFKSYATHPASIAAPTSSVARPPARPAESETELSFSFCYHDALCERTEHGRKPVMSSGPDLALTRILSAWYDFAHQVPWPVMVSE